MSCAKNLIFNEISRVERAMEQKLDELTKHNNKSYQWDIRVFYSFYFNEKHEMSDEYIIWVIYHENEDAEQQKYRFSFTSGESIFLTDICRSIYIWVTKEYLIEGSKVNEKLKSWYKDMNKVCFEGIADIFNISAKELLKEVK